MSQKIICRSKKEVVIITAQVAENIQPDKFGLIMLRAGGSENPKEQGENKWN